MARLRVLVSGASGQLGRHLRDRLDAAPRVRPLYVDGPSHGGPDLSQPGEAERTIAELSPDAVIHLAGLTGAKCDVDTERTHSINVASVRALAHAAADRGAHHFVLASTAAVYGDQQNQALDENASTLGTSAYALSKLAAERELELIRGSSFHTVSLRIFNVYGEGMTSSLVNRILNSTAANPVELRGLDEFVRDYVHARDVAAACEAALDVSEPNSIINVGSGDPVSNRQLISRLQRTREIHVVTSDGTPSYSYANIGKAREMLALAPAVIS